MVGVLFVCLGNICRSPLAEEVFREVTRKNLKENLFKIDSCGTADYHIGEKPDVRAIKTAFTHGLSLNHLGRQFKPNDFNNFTFIIAMDKNNQNYLLNLANNERQRSQVFRFRSFDACGLEELDVPDPYYGDISNFEEVYQIVTRLSNNLFHFINDEKNNL